MLNLAVIQGRLTKDIELRKTPNGTSVTRFSVAVERNFAKQGEGKKTDFIDVAAWGKTAEFVANYFKKGSMILIKGSIQTGSYEKDGVKRNTFEINAEEVNFCGSKEKTESTMFSNGKVDFEDIPYEIDDSEMPF